MKVVPKLPQRNKVPLSSLQAGELFRLTNIETGETCRALYMLIRDHAARKFGPHSQRAHGLSMVSLETGLEYPLPSLSRYVVPEYYEAVERNPLPMTGSGRSTDTDCDPRDYDDIPF